MIGMQYRIDFEMDFDINKIKERVKNNGHKTDGFSDLIFKLYLINEKKSDLMYAPLYLFKSHEGMNKFIFEGYFDNILNSFGKQKINHIIPIEMELKDIKEIKYVLESIEEVHFNEKDDLYKLTYPKTKHTLKNYDSMITFYNPLTWKFYTYFMFKDKPNNNFGMKLFTCLHVST